MNDFLCRKPASSCLSFYYCPATSGFHTGSSFGHNSELTARILRTNITKLDILESDMIMRTVAAGLPDTP